MSTIDKIIDSFPYEKLHKISGEPSYASIAEIHQQLNANAASIQSNLGNGILGHLWLTLKPEIFNTLSAIPFIPPENPGAQPEIPERSTAPQIASIRYNFESDQRVFQKYNNVEQALKVQLIAAVDEVFIQSLRNKYVGYANHTTKAILTYLYDSYAKITPSSLEANDKAMRAPLDPIQPLEVFFTRLEECQEFASAGNSPYTAQQVLNIAYQTLFTSGVYGDGCKDWRRKEAAEKTWANFKAHFANEYLDLKENQPSTTSSAYQATTEYQQDTVAALANLATATASDRDAVNNLTETNRALMAELTKVNAELITALKKINYMGQVISDLKSKSPSSPTAPPSLIGNNHYCWSCGFKSPHPSHKCNNKKEGHQDKATKYNTLDGSKSNFNK